MKANFKNMDDNFGVTEENFFETRIEKHWKKSPFIFLFSIFILIYGIMANPQIVYAAGSTAPLAANITVTNDATVASDTIVVTSLTEGDTVNVYSAATAGTKLGTAVVAAGESSVTITIKQLGVAAGTVYVSVKATALAESTRTAKAYLAEVTTATPAIARVTVTNNKVGLEDTVVVTGAVAGDIINVYNAATAGTKLGTTTVEDAKTTGTVTISQIGAGAGSVYVSIKSALKNESLRVAATFTSEISAAPVATAITVTNNYVGTSDKVVVTGLATGDVVNVYSAATAGTLRGTATVEAGNTSATVTIEQLSITAGTVYVSVVKNNKLESTRTTKAYVVEPLTTAPILAAITVTNNYTCASDTVQVTDLKEADVIKIYKDATSVTNIGTATVAEGDTSATITLTQLGVAAGSVFVTRTSSNGLESIRTSKTFIAEPISSAPLATAITVTNKETRLSDTVEVTGLNAGNIVNVYSAATAGSKLGTATVAEGETTATVTIAQISIAAGSVYVSVQSSEKNESARTAKAYIAEPVTTAPLATTITVLNNATGIDDKVSITGLKAGDIVNVYSAATAGSKLGTATVEEGKTSADLIIPQVGIAAGSTYVTVQTAAKDESARTAKAFLAEPVTPVLTVAQITVNNNKVDLDDTVTVTGLKADDIITLYSAATAGTSLGTETVSTGETSVAFTIEQLGAAAGNIYATVKTTGKNESLRLAKPYTAEITIAPLVATITATNNYIGTKDKIAVTGLAVGDVVNVYSAATAGNLLGTGEVLSGQTTGNVLIDQLSITSGTVYVSLVKVDKFESTRTARTYIAEPATTAPVAGDIVINNNYTGATDTITVSNLLAGDIIKLYTAATGGTAYANATVAEGETSVQLEVAQLGIAAGTSYITRTSANGIESVRFAKAYIAEPVTTAPLATAITVINNITDVADVVIVTGIKNGDTVNVYSAATAGTKLGSTTIETDQTTATISITQLGTAAGNVYVSIQSSGKNESARTVKAYTAEPTVDLTDLSISDSPSGFTFSASTYAYTGLTVPNSVASVKITPTGSGVIKVNGVIVATGAESTAIPLTIGAETTITVTATETGKLVKTYTFKITRPAVVTSVAISNTVITITKNAGTLQMTSTVLPATAIDKAIVWSVADGTGSATISNTGLLTAVSNGTVTITAKNESTGIKGTKVVTISGQVKQIPVTEITVTGTGSATTIASNSGTLQMVATILPTSSTNKTVVWSVEDGTGSASISATGLLTALSNGEVTVKATNTASGIIGTGIITISNQSLRAPLESKITTYNDSADHGSDVITVAGVQAGDKIKIYDAAVDGEMIAYGTVESGKSSITFNSGFEFPGFGGNVEGTVYVSVVRDGVESGRTAKGFLGSAYYVHVIGTVDVTNIVNNKPSMNDTFTVNNVEPGATIRVYSSMESKIVLGSAVVPAGKTSINMSVLEIGPGEGWIRLTQQIPGKEESYRFVTGFGVANDFLSDQTPFVVTYDAVSTNNNEERDGVKDQIGIKAPIGYVVKIYKTETGNDLLDTFTITSVNEYGWALFNLTNDLGGPAGDIYVTQTAPNLTESVRKYRAYSQEFTYPDMWQQITGVTPPVKGATPVTAITTGRYTATVSWSDAPVTFAAGTSYTATITITPINEYIISGIPANWFTVAGATSVTHDPNGTVITAVFPATAN